MGLMTNIFGLAVKGAKNVAGVQTIIESNKGALAKGKTAILAGQLAINANDATGKSWMQRNWRPLFMMSVVVMIIFNYLLLPVIDMIAKREIYPIIIPEQLWQAFMVGFGVYSAGRTYEKVKVNSAKAAIETPTPPIPTKQEAKQYRDLGMSAEQLASK